MLKKTLRYGTLIIPPIIYIKNRVDKGKPKILTPEQKHVVVIGAGVVGLTTSYFLSCDKNTSVTLLEKNKAIMSEASGQDSALFLKNQVSLRTLGASSQAAFSSFLRVDGPNCIYSSHTIKEPALIKFVWHWMLYSISSKINAQKSNTTLINEMTEKSFKDLQQLLEVTKIDVQLEPITMLSFKKLKGLNMSSEVKKDLAKNEKNLNLNQQVSFWGKKDLQKLYDILPEKYLKATEENTGSGIGHYNLVHQNETFSFDTRQFSEKLSKWLITNRSNFKQICNAEVSELIYDEKTGKVSSVKILGKRGDAIQCDAVVICTGASVARNLSQLLGVRCPILPVKSYSFDMPTSCTNKFAFIFEDKNVIATHLSPGFLRLNCFGDLAGFDTSYDKKRIRNMLNIVAKTFDTQEAMKNTNLKPILTGLSPDDLPLVGSLKYYPNVYVNVGHGFRALTLSFACGIMIQDAICNQKAPLKELSPIRFHI